MDHGSQYLSDHFLKQIRYWGIHPSFGFVEEPETNGVAERWNRTLKEQAIHGRIFQNLEAVRASFMLRKLTGKSLPLQTRTESAWLTQSLRLSFGSLCPPFLRELEFFWLRIQMRQESFSEIDQVFSGCLVDRPVVGASVALILYDRRQFS